MDALEAFSGDPSPDRVSFADPEDIHVSNCSLSWSKPTVWRPSKKQTPILLCSFLTQSLMRSCDCQLWPFFHVRSFGKGLGEDTSTMQQTEQPRKHPKIGQLWRVSVICAELDHFAKSGPNPEEGTDARTDILVGSQNAKKPGIFTFSSRTCVP